VDVRTGAIKRTVSSERDPDDVADGVGVVWRLTVNGPNPATATPFAIQLSLPSGLAHRNGKIYVSELNANRVSIFDAATGAPVSQITNVDSPEGLALAADGSLFVIESKPGRLKRIQPNGQRKTLVTGLGTNFKGLPNPVVNQFADVLIDEDGGLIVTEPLTGSIRRVDL
jgi:DNA-binding beta-propeller fold protein YncE